MAERTDIAVKRQPSEHEEDRTEAEIRRDIAARREMISETVDKLGDEIQKVFDWREYVSRYPYFALGAAAGAGLIVSRAFRRTPTPSERIVDAVADVVEDVGDNLRSSIDRVFDIGGPGKTVKAAVTAMIVRAALGQLAKAGKGRASR